jgi:regulator of replication initiation timing
MILLIIQFICLSNFFRSYIGSYLFELTNQTGITYGICILIAAAILLSYKISILGYVSKIAASACMAYDCVLIVNDFIKEFVQENNVLYADLLIFVIATAVFSAITISETYCTWFESNCEFDLLRDIPEIITDIIKWVFSPIIVIKKFFQLKAKKLSQAKFFHLSKKSKTDTKEIDALKEKLAYYEKNDFASANESLKHENQVLKFEIDQKDTTISEIKSILDLTKNDNNFLRAEVERIKSENSNQDIYKDIFFANCKSKPDIKERYRKLSTIFHPDCQNGDNTIFLNIKNAYEKMC